MLRNPEKYFLLDLDYSSFLISVDRKKYGVSWWLNITMCACASLRHCRQKVVDSRIIATYDRSLPPSYNRALLPNNRALLPNNHALLPNNHSLRQYIYGIFTFVQKGGYLRLWIVLLIHKIIWFTKSDGTTQTWKNFLDFWAYEFGDQNPSADFLRNIR